MKTKKRYNKKRKTIKKRGGGELDERINKVTEKFPECLRLINDISTQEDRDLEPERKLRLRTFESTAKDIKTALGRIALNRQLRSDPKLIKRNLPILEEEVRMFMTELSPETKAKKKEEKRIIEEKVKQESKDLTERKQREKQYREEKRQLDKRERERDEDAQYKREQLRQREDRQRERADQIEEQKRKAEQDIKDEIIRVEINKVIDAYCRKKAEDWKYRSYVNGIFGHSTDKKYIDAATASFSYEKYCRYNLSVEDYNRLNAEGIRNAQTIIERINTGIEKDNQELYELPLKRKNEEIQTKIDALNGYYIINDSRQNKLGKRDKLGKLDKLGKRDKLIRFFNEIVCPDVRGLAGGARYAELLELRNEMLRNLDNITPAIRGRATPNCQ